MNAKSTNSLQTVNLPSNSTPSEDQQQVTLAPEIQALAQMLLEEMQAEIGAVSWRGRGVTVRIALEIERISHKSSRIQSSGRVHSEQVSLARLRLQKCLEYYRLGSKRGRVELHTTLSTMVYRHVAPQKSQLGFQARCHSIEDLLQDFYAESLKAFRRENKLDKDYTPRVQIELAEYMAFTEHYAKRRVNLPNGYSQQLIVLRAQGFAKRQPNETTMDIEQAVEFAKGEEAEIQNRSPIAQQVRSQTIAAAIDPTEAVVRDRVFSELKEYLKSQGQSDCVDYLVLKMADRSAPEIDEILGLTSRQRDYLQQRFKYHVEKFARVSHWQLVHQWLGADLDQKLGMSSRQWDGFFTQLSPEYQELFQLKQAQKSDREIAKALKITLKQVQKRWTHLLEMAWTTRNSEVKVEC